MIPTYTGWLAMQPIVSQFWQAEKEAFLAKGYTIGGMLVFPVNRIDNKQTINGARGFTRKIVDRLDLTLECVRCHYRREPSPLGQTLWRYHDFFALFGDSPSVPKDFDTYADYRRRTLEFLDARNRRINQWGAEHRS